MSTTAPKRKFRLILEQEAIDRLKSAGFKNAVIRTSHILAFRRGYELGRSEAQSALGKSRSQAKLNACRENAKKGGRKANPRRPFYDRLAELILMYHSGLGRGIFPAILIDNDHYQPCDRTLRKWKQIVMVKGQWRMLGDPIYCNLPSLISHRASAELLTRIDSGTITAEQMFG